MKISDIYDIQSELMEHYVAGFKEIYPDFEEK